MILLQTTVNFCLKTLNTNALNSTKNTEKKRIKKKMILGSKKPVNSSITCNQCNSRDVATIYQTNSHFHW